jgi:hypothetical protein
LYKKAYVPIQPEKGLPERIISRSYINSINDKISNEEIYLNYYYHEKEMNITWHKYLCIYNVDGICGNEENDYEK